MGKDMPMADLSIWSPGDVVGEKFLRRQVDWTFLTSGSSKPPFPHRQVDHSIQLRCPKIRWSQQGFSWLEVDAIGTGGEPGLLISIE